MHRMLHCVHSSQCEVNVISMCSFVSQPIFTMSAQQNQLKSLDPNEFNEFMRSYRGNTVSEK